MGENSAISWTTHTFNPWWGCVKISPACTNCYAAAFDHRLGGEHWGPKSGRKFFGDKHWDGPRKWNASCQRRGVRERVFCASMADVFEDRPELIEHRARLYKLIDETPHLDWLLLTKRPENIADFYPVKWNAVTPHNVWLGTTVENQEYADERIPHLLDVPAVVHFLSCEPLLGPVNLLGWIDALSWVIAGCESGHGARPTSVEWLRFLRDQCAGRIPFLLKQAAESLAIGDKSVTVGALSKRKGKNATGADRGGNRPIVELPYLDGVQHAAFPEVRQ